MLWNTISKGLNVKLYYFIQPVSSWCKIKTCNQEKDIFALEDKDEKLKKIFKHVNHKKYIFLKKIIFHETRKNKIPCYDLNQFFSKKKFENKWLFSGKFHLTDEGSTLATKFIISKIIKG